MGQQEEAKACDSYTGNHGPIYLEGVDILQPETTMAGNGHTDTY